MQGYTNAKGEQIEGLCGGNLRYYTTEFIKTTKSTDDLRHRFINLCDDLLCIKEDTFTPVIVSEAKQSKTLKCFQKGEHYTAVCYDVREMDNLRKMIQDLDGKVSVYVFSLSKESCEEELADLPNVVVQNIPDDILETYKKIFQF
jgi:adenine-specific DNA-methyltransferase